MSVYYVETTMRLSCRRELRSHWLTVLSHQSNFRSDNLSDNRSDNRSENLRDFIWAALVHRLSQRYSHRFLWSTYKTWWAENLPTNFKSKCRQTNVQCIHVYISACGRRVTLLPPTASDTRVHFSVRQARDTSCNKWLAHISACETADAADWRRTDLNN